MPRRYPGRRRRRPGRRPPDRLGSRIRGEPAGFERTGLGPAYRVLLPGLRGREKREFLNALSRATALAIAAAAVVGGLLAGPLGAGVALVAGLAGGCAFVERGRYYRR